MSFYSDRTWFWSHQSSFVLNEKRNRQEEEIQSKNELFPFPLIRPPPPIVSYWTIFFLLLLVGCVSSAVTQGETWFRTIVPNILVTCSFYYYRSLMITHFHRWVVGEHRSIVGFLQNICIARWSISRRPSRPSIHIDPSTHPLYNSCSSALPLLMKQRQLFIIKVFLLLHLIYYSNVPSRP